MKFLRLLARVRFWKHRALKAEQQCTELITQFEAEIHELKESNDAEMWRNRSREDELITVPQRLQGLWGMPPRTGPARMKQVNQPSRALAQPADPWESLTWADKQEYELQWKDAALAQGIPEYIAKQQFLAELQSRRIPIHDEPFASN